MYYKNIISRFLLRKNFFRRIKMRLKGEKRKLVKNEFDDLEFLYEKLKTEPKIIFDGGANIGFVSYQFFKKFKNSKIYAFEPNPSVFKTLTTSLKDMKNVILPFNLGISDILPLTHSCGSNNLIPCGTCFNCQEREWAYVTIGKPVNLGI